jgi:hypothetical protein
MHYGPVVVDLEVIKLSILFCAKLKWFCITFLGNHLNTIHYCNINGVSIRVCNKYFNLYRSNRIFLTLSTNGLME